MTRTTRVDRIYGDLLAQFYASPSRWAPTYQELLEAECTDPDATVNARTICQRYRAMGSGKRLIDTGAGTVSSPAPRWIVVPR